MKIKTKIIVVIIFLILLCSSTEAIYVEQKQTVQKVYSFTQKSFSLEELMVGTGKMIVFFLGSLLMEVIIE